MGAVLSLTAPFFGIILIGFTLGRIARRPAAGLDWLNAFVLYVANPALFFLLVSRTPFAEISNTAFIGAVLAGTATILVAGFILALALQRGDIERATVKALVAAYANNGYLGPGLAIAALGTNAAVPVALIFAFENTMFFVAAPIAMAFGGARTSPGAMVLTIVRRVVTHPFILAFVAGAAAAAVQLPLPAVADRTLGMLGAAAAPCALFAMGVTVALQPTPTARTAAELAPFLALKLVAHPLLALLIVPLSGADPLWVTTAVLMAALPPASNVYVIATQYRSFVEGAGNAILLGTALSAVTVTAVLYAIRTGAL